MPESMYDKLGELLRDAIDSGNFFDQNQNKTEQISKETDSECIQNHTENTRNQQNTEKDNNFSSNNVHKSIHLNNNSSDRIVSSSKKLIKYAHPDIQKACSLLEITDDMNFDQAKSQYHKKLQRFHPDKNADNEIMRKITREKTGQIVEAWKLLEKWYSE